VFNSVLLGEEELRGYNKDEDTEHEKKQGK